jgi:hypothetical protein
VLGSWALGSAVLLVGMLGAMRPAALLLVLVSAAAAGRWRSVPLLARQTRWLLAAAIPLLPVAIAPPFFYDSWVYHLGLPWQALQEGSLHGHPGNLFSTFPPLAQLVYAVPLAAGATRAAGLIHLVGFITGGVAVTSLARRLGASPVPALLAGAGVLYLPTAMLVPGLPAAEAWMVAAITAAVTLAVTARPLRAAAVGAGLIAGVACAARLQGVPWAALTLIILAARSTKKAPRVMASFAIAVVAGSVPWWSKNAILLGDPLAPIGWDREGIETLWRDAASHLNLASGTADLLSRAAGAFEPLWWLVVPLLVAGFLGFVLRRRTASLLVVAAAAAGLLGWSLTGALGRFLTPSLALMLAAAAAVGRRRYQPIVAGAVTAGVLLLGCWSAWGMYGVIGGLSVMGKPSAVYASMVVSDPYPAFRACDELPAEARLLLVSEPRGFLLPRAFETTSQHDPSLLAAVLDRHATPEAAADELRGLGFTHLLVNVSEMRRLADDYPVLPWRDPEGRSRFVNLTQLLGKPVVLEQDVVVYSLKDDVGPRPVVEEAKQTERRR